MKANANESIHIRMNINIHISIHINSIINVNRQNDSSAEQQLAVTMADVETFLATFEGDASGVLPFKAVVKPVEGAGSDGVSICNARDEVRAAYRAFEGTKNVLGLDNYEVLLQEFLAGTEYVVDTVSLDGLHKVVAIWCVERGSQEDALPATSLLPFASSSPLLIKVPTCSGGTTSATTTAHRWSTTACASSISRATSASTQPSPSTRVTSSTPSTSATAPCTRR